MDGRPVLGGRFRVERDLGEGGWGRVVVATDLAIGRTVAVKTLQPELAENPDALERFREEAYSLASVHHPNIVELFDFYADGSDTFLVMELLEGMTLSTRIRRLPPITIEEAMDWTRQLLSALAAAHAKGVVHRDIKPSNLLLVPVPAQPDVLKVLDFGIAKLTEATLRRRPTGTGIPIGTPQFMSPEQARGAPIDHRSDIYSAALVLYMMLTNKNPFAGLDVAGTLRAVRDVVPEKVHFARNDVPAWLGNVIAGALAKDPAERPSSALELASLLDRPLHDADPTLRDDAAATVAPQRRRPLPETPAQNPPALAPPAAPPLGPPVATPSAGHEGRTQRMPNPIARPAAAVPTPMPMPLVGPTPTPAPLPPRTAIVATPQGVVSTPTHTGTDNRVVWIVLVVLGVLLLCVALVIGVLLGRPKASAPSPTPPPAAS